MLRPGYSSHPTDDPNTLSRRNTTPSPTTSTASLPTPPRGAAPSSRPKSNPPSFFDSVFGGMMRDNKPYGLASGADSDKKKPAFWNREGTFFGASGSSSSLSSPSPLSSARRKAEQGRARRRPSSFGLHDVELELDLAVLACVCCRRPRPSRSLG